MTMPKVAVKNMMRALGPSEKIAFRSVLNVKSINEAGSKYRDATKYKSDSLARGETSEELSVPSSSICLMRSA